MSQTKPLIELLGGVGEPPYNFIIPPYQRGYRWTEQEVHELLNDLWDFHKAQDEGGDFYCLQPIVVLKKTESYTFEVLDGQQRLTTLFLILSYLEDIRETASYGTSLFTINYITRRDCEIFLGEKKFREDLTETDNIDYYHLKVAYRAIKDWFTDLSHLGAKIDFLPILLRKNFNDQKKPNRNVRFIWYEVEENANPIDIFVRLNVGKIGLTDAELTKALLLQRDRYEPNERGYIEAKLDSIATEWNLIENELQNPEFWYFINNENSNKESHIEFIFDLLTDDLLQKHTYFNGEKPKKHGTFLILNKHLQTLIDKKDSSKRLEAVQEIWNSVSEYYEYLKNWFENKKLYHYIGYIITTEKGNTNKIIKDLIGKARTISKDRFVTHLETRIANLIRIPSIPTDDENTIFRPGDLQDLYYDGDENGIKSNTYILKILLLHNIFTTLSDINESSRFPFNSYKLYNQRSSKNGWTLEHIHAQNAELFTGKDDQNAWVKLHVEAFAKHKEDSFVQLVVKMHEFIQNDTTEEEEFKTLVNDIYAIIQNHSGTVSEKDMHAISNLCLLDKQTNSKLNNSIFTVKRELLKEQLQNGHYIPICTQNVFLKAYTRYPKSNSFWTSADRKDYMVSLSRVYNHFISSKEEKESL